VLLDVFRRGEKFCPGLLQLSAKNYSHFNIVLLFTIYLFNCMYAMGSQRFGINIFKAGWTNGQILMGVGYEQRWVWSI
jgi:hypothetical protein